MCSVIHAVAYICYSIVRHYTILITFRTLYIYVYMYIYIYIYLLKCYMGLSPSVHAHEELLRSKFKLTKETLNTNVSAAYSCFFSV